MRILLIISVFLLSAATTFAQCNVYPVGNAPTPRKDEFYKMLQVDGQLRIPRVKNIYSCWDTGATGSIAYVDSVLFTYNGTAWVPVRGGGGSSFDSAFIYAALGDSMGIIRDSLAAHWGVIMGKENLSNKIGSGGTPNSTNYYNSAAINTLNNAIYTAIADSVQGRVKYSDSLIIYATPKNVKDSANSVRSAIPTNNNQLSNGADYATNTAIADSVQGRVKYTDTAALSNRINARQLFTDTTTYDATKADLNNGLSPKLNSSDTAGLSSRINTKQNFTDTTSWDATKANLNSAISAQAITLNTSGVLYNTPINFTNSNGVFVGNLTLGSQSANMVLRVGSVTATPSFGALTAADLPGTVVYTNNSNAWTRSQANAISEVTYASTINPDFSLANPFRCQLTGNVILGIPTNITEGQTGAIYIYQDATGSRLLTSASWAWCFQSALIPTLSTVKMSKDILTYTVSQYKTSTVTMALANPGVVTWNNHGLYAGMKIQFTTTGALPTGVTANTTYYVLPQTANTFQLASSYGSTLGIQFSGSQSGTQTGTVIAIDANLINDFR